MRTKTYTTWVAKDAFAEQHFHLPHLGINWDTPCFTSSFNKKPILNDKGKWEGEQSHEGECMDDVYFIDLDDLKLKDGECKKVKITIEEIK